jgi:hypothetical protein
MPSNDAFAFEFSLDLTAQELLDLPAMTAPVEIEDIREVDPRLRSGSSAANGEWTRIEDSATAVEIELSAEQVLALLGGDGATG